MALMKERLRGDLTAAMKARDEIRVRTLRLTPLGEQLRAQLEPTYAQLTAAVDRARAASRGVTGQVRVGFTATTPSEPLTTLVQAFEQLHPDCQVTLHEHAITEGDWDMWRRLRDGESDALLYWNGMDQPDLTAGPVITWIDRVLLVARGHQLAGRESVSVEELACERVMQRPPSLPQDVMDMLIPPVTPSGRPIPRTEPVQSMHELVSLVARGRMVHPAGAGIPVARRTDVTQVPISDLPPIPMGLIWCTAHENARIRALAATAASIAAPSRRPAVPGPLARPGRGVAHVRGLGPRHPHQSPASLRGPAGGKQPLPPWPGTQSGC
jgi:DNA-binding transcriptional LysR family regulator